jgi:type IV secretory pathway TrbL component
MLSYYPLGAQIMTLVLPLGWFIVVMIAMYFVFSRPHTVPGHQAISGARPVAPRAGTAAAAAAATGFPTATGGGGTEPLTDRGTPPVFGAQSGDTAVGSAPDQAGADSSSTDQNAPEQAPDTGKSEDPE